MKLLDTDVCIELLRGNERVIRHRRKALEPVGISFMTVGELFYGAYKSGNPQRNMDLVEKFLLTVDVHGSSDGLMRKFGEIKATLQRTGQTLADADVLIAATAISGDGTLVTGNMRHYERIDDLAIEDWIKE